MDERVKHRLVGLAVITSLAVIIMPAVLKKSTQRYDLPKTAKYHLPKRPHFPKVVVKDEEETFHSVKIAHVNLDKAVKHKKKPIRIAKAKPIVTTVNHKPTQLALKPKRVKTTKKTKKAKTYRVQLASFTQFKNANVLVKSLSNKGFKAKTNKVTNNKGHTIYQVLVGNESKKEKAKQLQHQLAQATKLKGIVVLRRLS